MYPSNFQKCSTFSMCSNQLVINQLTKNKQNYASNGQLKLTIFQREYWKWNKNFGCGGLKVERVVAEKHFKFFGQKQNNAFKAI